jgi:hypothetical protein
MGRVGDRVGGVADVSGGVVGRGRFCQEKAKKARFGVRMGHETVVWQDGERSHP